MLKKTIDYEFFLPPGMDAQKEKDGFQTGMIFASIWCGCAFLFRYIVHHDALNQVEKDTGSLVTNSFPAFFDLMDLALLGFLLLTAAMVLRIWRYYQFFSQGARSLYTMKRLPQHWEISRRTLVLPLIWAGAAVLAAAAFTLVFCGFYVLVTPDRWLLAENFITGR